MQPTIKYSGYIDKKRRGAIFDALMGLAIMSPIIFLFCTSILLSLLAFKFVKKRCTVEVVVVVVVNVQHLMKNINNSSSCD